MRLALAALALSLAPRLVAQAPLSTGAGTHVRVWSPNQEAYGSLVSLRGDTVVIADSTQHTVSGRFAGYELRERTYLLNSGSQLQVLSGYRGHAGTGALIGGAIGGLAGFALGSAIAGSQDLGSSHGSAKLTGVMLLGFPGLLLGAAIGSIKRPVWTLVDTSGRTARSRVLPSGVEVSPEGVGLHWQF